MNQIYQLRRGRAFRLTRLPDGLPKNAAHLQILDVYPAGTNLRWRSERDPIKRTRRFWLEHFVRTNDASCYLATFARPATEESLWRRFDGAEIRKNRYVCEIDGEMATVDVYLGTLRGLIIARFESDSESKTPAEIGSPEFVEITGDSRYFDEILARRNK